MKRTLIAAVAAAALALPASAVAAPPSLDGETLLDNTPTITSLVCGNDGIKLGYSVNGTASGPYAGTFAETGALDGTSLTATFTIDTALGRVTGTKTAQVGVTCRIGPPCSGVEPCADRSAIYGGEGTYRAVIRTPGGAFTDQGTFSDFFYRCPECPPDDPVFNRFDSTFSSELDEPTALTKSQCKNGGWRALGFRNQGDCVRVAGKP
jgi:hypothetical protein